MTPTGTAPLETSPDSVRRTVPFGARLAAAGLLPGAGGNTLQDVLGQVANRPDDVAGDDPVTRARRAGRCAAAMKAKSMSGTASVPLTHIVVTSPSSRCPHEG